MDKEYQQLTPYQIMRHAEKHPHSVNISTQAFAVDKRDYVVHNLSLKGDPNNDFDVANYRRGLTFLEQIVNFKQIDLRVAKKGLRKFYDLLPEYLDQKISHISNSKHYSTIRHRLIEPLKSQFEEYSIYSTEKANGENAQISWDAHGKFWVIGSKNKTLLLSQLKDVKYINNKHEHVRTVGIAQEWFRILEQNEQHIQKIKEKLSQYVLIGQICDSVKSGHIVDYGNQAKLFFYAIVSKLQQQFSCESPSNFLQFMKESNLIANCVKFKVIPVKTYEALIEELRKEMYNVYQGSLEQYGEGTVVYISAKKGGVESCYSVCKVKTLEYRIYRKLREKLKVFLQKFRKSYDKILNKYIEQVRQLTKGFKTPKEQEYYFRVAKKAFDFCSDQQKAVSKFFHNKYIGFLKLIQNENVTKEDFKKIMHKQIDNIEIKKIATERDSQVQLKLNQQKSQLQQLKQVEKGQQKKKNKNVCVCIGLTIPATGKSTLFKHFMANSKDIFVQILSSDTVRSEKMAELMKRQKNLTKQDAYDRTRDSANKQFYRKMDQILSKMDKSSQEFDKFILFIDKNNPQSALKPAIEQINKSAGKCKNLTIKIVAMLPKCNKLIAQKSKYSYPFSTSYIACCIKRVLARNQHETLEGSEEKRATVCISFANMFRNFGVTNYSLSKYFNGVIRLPFTQEQEIPGAIEEGILKIMLGSKIGNFDEHSNLPFLLQEMKKWKNEQVKTEQRLEQVLQIFEKLFDNFEEMKIDLEIEKEDEKEKKRKKGRERQKKKELIEYIYQR